LHLAITSASSTKSNRKHVTEEYQKSSCLWDSPKRQNLLPQKETFLNTNKALSLNVLPLETKETTFQVLNRTFWIRKKAFKSGLILDPTCLRCETLETMEHLPFNCDHYSAKIWALLVWAFTLSLSRHMGEYYSGYSLNAIGDSLH
jgi:hypothetical protein